MAKPASALISISNPRPHAALVHLQTSGQLMVILHTMKRPIYVRPLSDAERNTLEAGLRSPDAFTLRRCQVLLASADGQNAYQIATILAAIPKPRAMPSTSLMRR